MYLIDHIQKKNGHKRKFLYSSSFSSDEAWDVAPTQTIVLVLDVMQLGSAFWTYVVVHICYRLFINRSSERVDVRNLKVVYTSNSAQKTKLKEHNVAAVIVEHRPLPELGFVIEHFAKRLPPEVKIHVFHGDNEKFLKSSQSISNAIKSSDEGRILFTNTGFGSTTRKEYNQYLKSKKFWNVHVKDYDYVLIFQADTLLCQSKVELVGSLDTFFDYDYIGAPWDEHVWNPKGKALNRPPGFPCACLQDRSLPRTYTTVGNGGLSWRNREAMLQVLESFSNRSPYNEDLFFSCGVQALPNLRLANESFAATFAIESMATDTTVPPFGIHKTWYYVDRTALDSLVCPSLPEFLGRWRKEEYASSREWDGKGADL